MSHRTFYGLAILCRILSFIYLVALAVVVFGFFVYLWKTTKQSLNPGTALAINIIGILLVWACPFCRLADYFERKGDQTHG